MALSNGNTNPFIFALYRELAASVMMYFYVQFKEINIKIDQADYGTFLFLGACSFLNVVLACCALQYISATRYAILQPSVPCLATVIAVLNGIESFSLSKLLGVIFAVIGALVVVLSKSSSASTNASESHVLLGTAIVLMQVSAMANLVVFQKSLLSKYDPCVVTFIYYSTGAVLTVVLCIFIAPFYFQFADLYFSNNTLPWYGLAYATTFATLYSYNAISWAGKQLTPSSTAVFCTFQPVGTMILSLFLFGLTASASEGAGAVLVIVGLLVNVLGGPSEPVVGESPKEIVLQKEKMDSLSLSSSSSDQQSPQY